MTTIVPSVTEAFAPLKLSSSETQQILSDADEIIAETLLAFEDFVTHGRNLDAKYWEFLKSHAGMAIYRTRASENHALPPSGAVHGRDYFHEKSFVEQFRPKQKIPFVISVGTISGTIEDSALGWLADSADRSRLRTSYLFPEYHVSHLMTIETPTREDPFRFVGIKWGVRALPPPWRTREMVFSESTGLAVDSNGDRVAYLLMHSIKHSMLPELSQYNLVRSNGSICFVYRQLDAETVEVFCQTWTDPNSDTLVEASLNSENFAESMISPHTVVECAYVKKLTWLMVQKTTERKTKSTQMNLTAATHCALCEKSFSQVAEEEDELGNTGFLCQVCGRCCCSLCTVSKEMVRVDSDGEEMDEAAVKTQCIKPSGCCVACALDAKNLSAWDVALATLL